MINTQYHFNNIRMTFKNCENHRLRSDRISQLTFNYLQQMIETHPLHLISDRVIDRLEITPIQVSFEKNDDETIARTSAAEIYRSILQEL